MADGFVVAPHLLAEIRRQLSPSLPRSPEPGISPSSLFGVSIRIDPIFPIRKDCGICVGTGEGVESTYCPSCRGGGAIVTNGMFLDRGRTTLIVEYLPPFAPRFPANVFVQPPLMRGWSIRGFAP